MDKARPDTTIQAPPVARMIAVQSAALLILSAVILLVAGRVSAYSLLTGGLISLLPTAYFAHKAFRYRGARAMTQAVKAIYLGELIKLVLMGTGFALAFNTIRPLDALALFAGFVLVHVTGIAALVTLQQAARK